MSEHGIRWTLGSRGVSGLYIFKNNDADHYGGMIANYY